MENITNSLPTRYLWKIESFSLLSQNGTSKYESNVFESGGFNWTTKFLFDAGMERRFHNIKTVWGFSKCISHETLKDPTNGYVVDDKCVVGVDIYVVKKQGIGECMSLLNGTEPYKHEWKITEFSKLKRKVYYSEQFIRDGYKWKLLLYPTGDNRENGKNISVYLESVDAKGFNRQKRVKAKFSISLKNQNGGEHHKRSGGANWYSAASYSWGWSSFMRCCELNDRFLIEDCCVLEAEVSVVGVVNCLT
uniref:MATH domain-containing protein n=1 Tax=Solanum lycopersicum TaxID=4081 RepID=A0A3Q7GPC9_SOLLC